MRILVLIHEYPPVGGGGGQSCQDIATELVRRGHEITIITAAYASLPLDETSAGFHLVRVTPPRKLAYKAGLWEMAAFVITSTIKALKVARNFKPDLIHAHFAVPAGAAAYLVSLLTGIPYVITAHLGDVPGGVPEKTRKWFRVIYPFTIPIWKKAAKVIAVSQATATLATKSYGLTPGIIPNGIPLEPDPGKKPGVNTPPVVFFAGRFVEQKNLRVFVEVLTALKHLPWRCVMLGDGALKYEIERSIKTSNLEDRFHLPGWVSPDTVQQYMRNSDILFMPSLSEGLSVVGVQALSAGLAIVAYDVGGFSDLVEQGVNGYLVEPGNPQGLQVALQNLLSDTGKLIAARNASLAMVEKFNITNVVDQYEKVFTDLQPSQLQEE